MAKGRHFKDEKRETIKTAKELLYDEEVIKRLSLAESREELTRIMQNARKGEI